MRLTPREEELAQLVADGWPAKVITARMRVSRATYAKMLAVVAVKVGAPDHAIQSVAIARWWGRHRDAAPRVA